MKIIVDGNDGTGKSTLVNALRGLGYDAHDRGLPTLMTDDLTLKPKEKEVYLILDVPVEVSCKRLANAGKDLTEHYHTVEDLTYYRQKFLEVAAILGPVAKVINSNNSHEEVLKEAISALEDLLINMGERK